jgi:hypothetical protein
MIIIISGEKLAMARLSAQRNNDARRKAAALLISWRMARNGMAASGGMKAGGVAAWRGENGRQRHENGVVKYG